MQTVWIGCRDGGVRMQTVFIGCADGVGWGGMQTVSIGCRECRLDADRVDLLQTLDVDAMQLQAVTIC